MPKVVDVVRRLFEQFLNPFRAGIALKRFGGCLLRAVVVHAFGVASIRPRCPLVGFVRRKVERSDYLFDELEKLRRRFAACVLRNFSNGIDDPKQIMREIAQAFLLFVSRGLVDIRGVIQLATIGELTKPHTF